MNLNQQIESAEHRLKQILEEFFISVYDEKKLISHGIDHHRRVWIYARELLEVLYARDNEAFSGIAPKLLIACYLHDIGMAFETGPDHGSHSKDLCARFLADNHFEEVNYQDVLEAIGNHDNKDYADNSGTNRILTVLSVADDLDAFGFIGIFRFSEIYLKRGIHPGDIGKLIKENSAKRFANFLRIFGTKSELVNKHTIRYNILNDFFTDYNFHIPSYHFGSLYPCGYCGIMELFMLITDNNKKLLEFCKDPENYSHDRVIRWFFVELGKELTVWQSLS